MLHLEKARTHCFTESAASDYHIILTNTLRPIVLLFYGMDSTRLSVLWNRLHPIIDFSMEFTAPDYPTAVWNTLRPIMVPTQKRLLHCEIKKKV